MWLTSLKAALSFRLNLLLLCVNSFSRPRSLFLPPSSFAQLDKDQQGTETDVIPHPMQPAAYNGRASSDWVRARGLHVSSQVELPIVILLIMVTILAGEEEGGAKLPTHL